MHTCKYDQTNHTFTIMNTEVKRGITLLMIGNDIAQFLRELVKKANKVAEFERQTGEVVIIDGRHYRAMNDNEATIFIWARDNIKEEDKTEKSQLCGNCGTIRFIHGATLEKCPQCGDDETDLAMQADGP